MELLLIVAFSGALVTYFLGKVSSGLRDGFAVVLSFALVVFVACLYGRDLEEPLYSGFLGLPLQLRLNALGWIFAISITVVGALSIVFSLSYIKKREKTDFYYLMMLLVNAAMLGIVTAGDLVSFFIFWEIMSWSAFLLISYNRGPALAAGMQYIIMSVIGSGAMLIGILSLKASYGTLIFSELSVHMADASSGYALFILILFFVAFGIKNAVWPFHTWLPPAHSEAASPFSAVLSGILVRMGMYGFLLFFYGVAGAKLFLGLGKSLVCFHDIIAWLGVINIVIPTFIAMLQNDCKRLLAWHGVGQGGYMVLGAAFGSSLGLAGGNFHIINYTSHIALLFLVVGAVEYRTGGIRDLNRLGGLATKMPVTFIGALVGACGLIGLPLTNGFVSKWLIYKTLILEGRPFLAFGALIGTWGTILSLYKFVHNMFMGQLPREYGRIEKAPLSMQVPIIFYSTIIVLFGILPGIPLKVINAIGTSFGFASLSISIWGTASESGVLNTINIFSALVLAGIVVWLLLKAGPGPVKVEQHNNYAAGIPVPEDRYAYTVEFYNPLFRMISPYLRDFVEAFYMRIAAVAQALGNRARRIYTGDVGCYAIYITLFLAFLIFAQMRWNLWQ